MISDNFVLSCEKEDYCILLTAAFVLLSYAVYSPFLYLIVLTALIS